MIAMTTQLKALRERSFVVLRPLAPNQIADVRDFLLSREVFFNAHVPQTSRAHGRMETVARDHQAAELSECICVHTSAAIAAPHLLERGLEHLDLASAYLGRDPAVCYSANAFWTRPPGQSREDIQELHVDQDDERFLSMFVYLTDVLSDDDGPHDIEGADGVLRSIYGRAGTVFIANPMRPHRGRKPKVGERGLYWWRYGVSDRPPANAWDKVEPIPAAEIGDRYPADARLRESIRLLVTPP